MDTHVNVQLPLISKPTRRQCNTIQQNGWCSSATIRHDEGRILQSSRLYGDGRVNLNHTHTHTHGHVWSTNSGVNFLFLYRAVSTQSAMITTTAAPYISLHYVITQYTNIHNSEDYNVQQNKTKPVDYI